MFTLEIWTADPTLATSSCLTSGDFKRRWQAEKTAIDDSKGSSDYYAVYAEDGEQLSGFVNGKQVY